MSKTITKYKKLYTAKHHCHIAKNCINNKLYVYDNSGNNPDETDDGPLRIPSDLNQIIVEAPLQRGDWTSNYGPAVNIPVISERHNKTYSSSISLQGALVVGKQLKIPVYIQTKIYNP